MAEAIQYSNEVPETASSLPEPSGYHLLIALPEVEETTEAARCRKGRKYRWVRVEGWS